MTITVFLNRDVPELGRGGQVVTVSQAYARNFLLPKGLAVVATPALIAQADREQTQAAAAKTEAADQARQAAAKLAAMTIHLSARANPQGKLFAAVKADQVFTAIQAQTNLRLPPTTKLEPAQVKTVGDHPAKITLANQSIEFTIHLDHADRA